MGIPGAKVHCSPHGVVAKRLSVIVMLSRCHELHLELVTTVSMRLYDHLAVGLAPHAISR